MKKTLLLSLLLSAFVAGMFVACNPETDFQRTDWVGSWKLQENPLKSEKYKAKSGNIRLDPNSSNQIIISGALFGLVGEFHAKVDGADATYQEQNTRWNIRGTANMRSVDEILFLGEWETEEEQTEINAVAIRLN